LIVDRSKSVAKLQRSRAERTEDAEKKGTAS
jgi:hypothetical protein